MNKTVTVNIGGIVFHIDENAYEKFKLYLEAIRGHFTKADGRDEIMQDIEARIAEMFQERVKDSKQVITLEDVEEVTRLMGKPEEFAGTGELEAEEEDVSTGPVKRRLFRNPDDKLLGGVCSGVSAYFDIDPVWIRLAFAISFFAWGAGFWLYIILWIVMPEAKTAADKLQMKGEPVTVSNIQKSVKEEMDALKRKVDEMSKDGARKSGTVIGRIFEAIGEVFVMIFKVIGKIIAVIFIFIGIIVAIVMFASMFALMGVPGTHIPNMWHTIFNSQAQFAWSYIGILLLVGIPFLMLAYAGVRMLFNLQKGSRIVGSTAFGLWILGVFICLYNGFVISKEFREKETVRKEIPLAPASSKMLYLEMNEAKNSEKNYERDYGGDFDWHFGDHRRMIINGKEYASGRVKLDIVKSKTDSFELVEIFYANGPSRKEAAEFASRINYSFIQNDSLVLFNRFFTVDKDVKFRNQHIQLVLKMPVGARVHLDKSFDGFIYDVDNLDDIYDSDMVDRNWEMTLKGLKCLNCDGTEHTIGGENFRIHGEDGENVTIDKYGVHIDASARVAIDSNGIIVNDQGKEIVKINKDGIHINTDDTKKRYK